VASTWSALRRRPPTPRPKYPASARRLRRGSSGKSRRAMSCVHTMSSGGSPPARIRRNGCSNRAKWMTVGAGCGVSLAASSASSRQTRPASAPSRIIGSEIPVIRVTAGGIFSSLESAMRCARAWMTVVRDRAHAISRRCPRGAAPVAWQSITSTSSCESGTDRSQITISNESFRFDTGRIVRLSSLRRRERVDGDVVSVRIPE